MFRFWTELLDRVQKKKSLHAAISPKRGNWLIDSAGVRGLAYGYVVRKNDARVELYIDRDGDVKENKAIFDALAADKEAIEATFGELLEWQRKDNAVISKVQKRIDLGGYADESKWADVQELMIESMIRLDEAFKPYIRKLTL
jgi:hypothetical protein